MDQPDLTEDPKSSPKIPVVLCPFLPRSCPHRMDLTDQIRCLAWVEPPDGRPGFCSRLAFLNMQYAELRAAADLRERLGVATGSLK